MAVLRLRFALRTSAQDDFRTTIIAPSLGFGDFSRPKTWLQASLPGAGCCALSPFAAAPHQRRQRLLAARANGSCIQPSDMSGAGEALAALAPPARDGRARAFAGGVTAGDIRRAPFGCSCIRSKPIVEGIHHILCSTRNAAITGKRPTARLVYLRESGQPSRVGHRLRGRKT